MILAAFVLYIANAQWLLSEIRRPYGSIIRSARIKEGHAIFLHIP